MIQRLQKITRKLKDFLVDQRKNTKWKEQNVYNTIKRKTFHRNIDGTQLKLYAIFIILYS